MTIAHLEIRQKLAAANTALEAAIDKAREERFSQIAAHQKMRAEYLESARRCLLAVSDLYAEIQTDDGVVKANEALETAIEEARASGATPASWGTEGDLLCCAATKLPLLHGDEVFGDPADGVAVLKSAVWGAIDGDGAPPLETYPIVVDDEEEAEEEDATSDI